VTEEEYELFQYVALRLYHNRALSRSTRSRLILDALYHYIQAMGYGNHAKEFLLTQDPRVFGYLPNEDIVLAV
jgi:hypothetical protein